MNDALVMIERAQELMAQGWTVEDVARLLIKESPQANWESLARAMDSLAPLIRGILREAKV